MHITTVWGFTDNQYALFYRERVLDDSGMGSGYLDLGWHQTIEKCTTVREEKASWIGRKKKNSTVKDGTHGTMIA